MNTDPFPQSPFRTHIGKKGGVATIKEGSFADYLERMEQWLERNKSKATGQELQDIELALHSIRRERQEYAQNQSGSE